jgi:hypothetical protein
MDNPSSVLIDIHGLDSTPADHDRNLTNKVHAKSRLSTSWFCFVVYFFPILTMISSECRHEDPVQARVINDAFDFLSPHFAPFSPLILVFQ